MLKLEYNGKIYSKKELCKKFNIHPNTFDYRYKKLKLPISMCLSQSGRCSPIEYNGIKYKSEAELCRKYNLNIGTFYFRYHVYGWTLEESIVGEKRKATKYENVKRTSKRNNIN